MKNAIRLVAILAIAVFLGACASPGKVMNIPVTMPDGEKMTIVAHNQQVPDWWLDRNQLALNFIVKGEVSSRQLAAIAEAERACRLYTNAVRPSNLVSVLSQGAVYALAGAIGVGLGSQAFKGADFAEYAIYGGSASGAGGVANGIVTIGGQTYTFENCGREITSLAPKYEVRVLQKSPY